MKAPNLQVKCNSLTTFILGAGFSKCAELPSQSEFSSLILSPEFDSNLDKVITKALQEFLGDVFGWVDGSSLPSLEDIFTCIDLSAATGHHLGVKYTPKRLRALRRMAIYRIFSILDRKFSYSSDIEALLKHFLPNCAFVVLNWDIVLEKHLRRVFDHLAVDYCCASYDWHAAPEGIQRAGVRICKMHGSSNWVYCENCKALFFDLDEKLSLRTKAGLVKLDFRLFDEGFTDMHFDQAIGVPPRDRECRFCRNMVSSHIATFSFRKSFRTHAYSSIWYQAERLLSEADHWIFVGYSLPEADYELKHLLKAAQLRLVHRKNILGKRIEVVTMGKASTREKYDRFFGGGRIEFHHEGLSGYVSRLRTRATQESSARSTTK